MSDQLSKKQLSEYRDSFALFDKNGDGKIDSSELSEVMRCLGRNPTKEELKDMIDDIDSDNNGAIDFNEFLGLMSKVNDTSVDNDDDLIETFNVFDKDEDGYINQDELRSVMSQLGQRLTPKEIDEMIKEADIDGDGKINYKEFARMMIEK